MPKHFTFLSFRFETRYGFSVARSPALTCTSQFHVTRVWPSSVGIRFVKTYVPGPRSVKYAVPFTSTICVAADAVSCVPVLMSLTSDAESSVRDSRFSIHPRAVDLALRDASPADQAAFWTGLLADHDVSTQFQLATMLDGHDAIDLLSNRAGRPTV